MSVYESRYHVSFANEDWIVESHCGAGISMTSVESENRHQGSVELHDGVLTCWGDEWDIYKEELYPIAHQFLEGRGGPEGEKYKITRYDDDQYWPKDLPREHPILAQYLRKDRLIKIDVEGVPSITKVLSIEQLSGHPNGYDLKINTELGSHLMLKNTKVVETW